MAMQTQSCPQIVPNHIGLEAFRMESGKTLLTSCTFDSLNGKYGYPVTFPEIPGAYEKNILTT